MVNPILFFDSANQTRLETSSRQFIQSRFDDFPTKKTPPGGWEPGISMGYMGLPAMGHGVGIGSLP
jgi:hypothetical protein